MEFFILAGLGLAAVIFLPKMLADEKTKLFRRVWSAERVSNSERFYESANVVDAKFAAINRLKDLYGINEGVSTDQLRKSIAVLLADALTFDLKHPVNGGVEVAVVLAQHMRSNFPNLNDVE